MKIYLSLFCRLWLLGLVLVLIPAAAGSYDGAEMDAKQVTRFVHVVNEDDPIGDTSYWPRASEQNTWFNFKFAAQYSVRGFLAYGVVVLICALLYNSGIGRFVRKVFQSEDGNKLFI